MKLNYFALSTLIVSIGLSLPAIAQRTPIPQVPLPGSTIIQQIERPPYPQDFFRQGQEQFERQIKLLMQGKYSKGAVPLKICYEIITSQPFEKPEIRNLDPCRSVKAIHSIKTVDNNVEVELFSGEGFPVINDILLLRIGDKEFTSSNFLNGDTHRLVYTLSRAEFAGVVTGDRVQLCQQSKSNCSWDFGKLDKQVLDITPDF